MNRTIGCTLSAFALCVVLAGCASPPRAEKYTAMPVGSTWVSQVRATGSYAPSPPEVQARIVQVDYKGQTHSGFQTGPNTMVQAPTGDWMALLAPDGKPMLSWDPPIGFNWPIEVGKTWSRSFKFTNHANNQAMDIVADAVVEAYEEVTVPAGTFKTFRIHVTNNVGADEMFWMSPEYGLFVKQVLKRTDKAPQGAGVREAELKSLTIAK